MRGWWKVLKKDRAWWAYLAALSLGVLINLAVVLSLRDELRTAQRIEFDMLNFRIELNDFRQKSRLFREADQKERDQILNAIYSTNRHLETLLSFAETMPRSSADSRKR